MNSISVRAFYNPSGILPSFLILSYKIVRGLSLTVLLQESPCNPYAQLEGL